ncbi:hypothetical protein FB451DRAFT_581314 [Mycena latifolia]|nr:hypothetical protein FB451DRAFT_581314 [Mycena latifolia]
MFSCLLGQSRRAPRSCVNRTYIGGRRHRRLLLPRRNRNCFHLSRTHPIDFSPGITMASAFIRLRSAVGTTNIACLSTGLEHGLMLRSVIISGSVLGIHPKLDHRGRSGIKIMIYWQHASAMSGIQTDTDCYACHLRRSCTSLIDADLMRLFGLS